MKFLHLSDLHFVSITLNPLRLLSKRALGMGNVLLNRQFKYRQNLLDPILERLSEVDQVWITGDLTTTAMEEEFQQAKTFLEAIRSQEKEILLVPGNHDRYTEASRQEHLYEKELESYLQNRSAFPFLSYPSDSLALIGLDATSPVSWLSAAGRLSEDHYQKLEALLQDPLLQAKRIIVLCHYPLVYPAGFHEAENHKMVEKEKLLALLTRYGVNLYLHGHSHHQWILPPNASQPLIVNSGSSTKKKEGGYVIFTIEKDTIHVSPYLHHPKHGWRPQPALTFPFRPAQERSFA
jgi:3',5'-cyclic AMP phosphodiesterase CpdA